MQERELRSMIAEVKTGRGEPPSLRPGHGRARPDRADGRPDAGLGGRGAGPDQDDVQADQARRRRAAQDALVAGRDPAQPALRRRHQGPGRLAHLLRAARLVGPGRQPDPLSSPPRSRRAQNGGVAKDGKSVTWKLKKGVVWHDGKPFTADDCVFTWEYVADPATASANIGSYKDIKVEKVDSHTIRVTFQQAHAVLGGRLLRRARHDHPQAPVRGLQGRQVPRGADEPQAGGHRARTSSWTSSRATWCAAS